MLPEHVKGARYCKRISDTCKGETFYYSFHPQISPFGTIDTRFRTFIALHKSIYLVFSTGPTGQRNATRTKSYPPEFLGRRSNVVTSRGPITLESPTGTSTNPKTLRIPFFSFFLFFFLSSSDNPEF